MGLFSKLFKQLPLPPSPITLPGSFADKAAPDHTFEIGGLQIGAHTQGAPKFAFTHFTVSRGRHEAPVSAVPEPSIAVMMAVGVAVMLLILSRSHRKDR